MTRFRHKVNYVKNTFVKRTLDKQNEAGHVTKLNLLFINNILAQTNRYIYVLFLTSDNEFLGIIYSFFRGRQNIFLTIVRTKFVVKFSIKISMKIG